MYGFYECDSTVMDAKQLPSQHAEPSCYSYEKPFLNNVSREYSQTFGHHFHQSQMPQYSSQGITDHPGFYPNEFAFERLLSESKKPVHNNKDADNVKVPQKDILHKVRFRSTFTNSQIDKLEKEFSISMYISRPRIAQLAKELDLTEKRIKVWFQNRRCKARKDGVNTNVIKLLKTKMLALKKEDEVGPNPLPSLKPSPTLPTQDTSTTQHFSSTAYLDNDYSYLTYQPNNVGSSIRAVSRGSDISSTSSNMFSPYKLDQIFEDINFTQTETPEVYKTPSFNNHFTDFFGPIYYLLSSTSGL